MIEDYQTVAVEIRRAPARDKWGEEETARPSEFLPATRRPSSARVTAPGGEEVVASEVLAFAPGTAIGYDDRIILDGREARVVRISRAVTLDGEASVRVYVA